MLSGIGEMRASVPAARSDTDAGIWGVIVTEVTMQGAEQGTAHIAPVPEQLSKPIATGIATKDTKTRATISPARISHLVSQSTRSSASESPE